MHELTWEGVGVYDSISASVVLHDDIDAHKIEAQGMLDGETQLLQLGWGGAHQGHLQL